MKKNSKFMSYIGTLVYRGIESVDGEKKYKIIPYPIAERIKLFVLTYFI